MTPDVYLEGSITRQSMLSREHQGSRAVQIVLERLANGYDHDCGRVQQDLSIAKTQLSDYQTRLDKPFTLDAYFTELTGLRDQLKAGLSGSPRDPNSEEGLSISEFADKIKALKTAHNIEASPLLALK